MHTKSVHAHGLYMMSLVGLTLTLHGAAHQHTSDVLMTDFDTSNSAVIWAMWSAPDAFESVQTVSSWPGRLCGCVSLHVHATRCVQCRSVIGVANVGAFRAAECSSDDTHERLVSHGQDAVC